MIFFIFTGFIQRLKGQESDVVRALNVDEENNEINCLVTKNKDLITINVSGNGSTLVFKRLPQNDDIAEIVAAGVSDESSERLKYELPSVFLSETELTIEQLRSLLSPKSFEGFKSSINSYMGGPDDPKFGPYVKAVNASNEDASIEQQCPVILVGLGTIAEACSRLNNILKESSDGDSLTEKITEATFRVPATKEWQYAARFTSDLDVAETRQIFPNWADLNESEDVGLRGQWADICDANSIPFTSSPTVKEVCEAADTVFAKGKNKDGYDLLGDILSECMETNVHITHNDSQCILPVINTGRNAWGLLGLFGNASEWTLRGETISDVDESWMKISSGEIDKETAAQEMFNIMGGQFLNTYAKSQAWKLWSIADGNGPIQTDVFQAESKNSDQHDMFVDLKAGVRLCVHNKLSKNWFVTYRRQVLSRESIEELNSDFTKCFVEICTTGEQTTLAHVLEDYNSLKMKTEACDELDVVCQVTRAMVDANKQLLSTTSAGKTALKEQEVTDSINELAGLDLGILAGDRKKPDPESKDSAQSGMKSTPTRINFFSILEEVNTL